jgi:hypothetical protein
MNDAPVANNDAAAVTEGGTVTVPTSGTSVLDNDTDIDNATLTASLITNPTAGTFSLSSDGTFSFTADGSTIDALSEGEILVTTATYQAFDGTVASNTASLSISVTGVNDAPVFTSAADPALDENTAAVTTVTATDVELDTVTFSITGGADMALFAIDTGTGALTFAAAPDFEVPGDSDMDNVYEVTVTADDGTGTATATSTQALTVTVGAVDDNSPVFTSGITADVTEGTTAVQTAAATDDDLPGDTLVFTISGGTDSAAFAIDGMTGDLTFVSAPDFDVPGDDDGDNVYDVQVQVSDGTTDVTQDVNVTILGINDELPIIGSADAVSVAENDTAVVTVTATDADVPADTLTFSISGGADSSAFGIDAVTGDLTFNAAPDFETPGDADTDNVFDVQVQVSDGTNDVTQDITVTVTAVDDNSPVIGSADNASVTENATAVLTVAATDADLPADTLTFSISGGADAAAFAIDSLGVLTFASAPDFDVPGDSDGDNIYDVQVSVTDGTTAVTQDIAVTVTGVDDNAPVIGSANAASVAENGTAVLTVAATDGDAPGDTLVFSVSGGADAAAFGIDAMGVLTFNTAPDFETPGDADGDNVFDVQVQVSDGTNDVTQDITVTVTAVDDNSPVITSADSATVPEGSTTVSTVTATDADLPGDTLTFGITGAGADDAQFAINPDTGELTFVAAPDFDSPADADGDNVYLVQVSVSDGTTTVTEDGTVSVTQVPPVLVTVDGSGNLAITDIQSGGSTNIITVTLDGATNEFVVSAATTQLGDGINPVTDEIRVDAATVTGVLLVDLAEGDDRLAASSLNISVVATGGAGEDTLIGGSGDDQLTGDAGEDRIFAGAGDDVVSGGADDDRLFGDGGTDAVDGGDGDDFARGGSGDDIVDGGLGSDVLNGDTGDDQISGGDDADEIFGGNGLDLIFGDDGDDSIHGDNGYDTISGGNGDDTLRGGRGRDDLDGEDGNDLLAGDLHEDTLRGGDGDDVLNGGDAVDRIFGGEGNDALNGGDGFDSLFGDDGLDTISGGGGNDFIRGGDDGDSLLGDDGNDTLFGDAGNDFVDGGLGADEIQVLQGGVDTVVDGDMADMIFKDASDLLI